MTGERRVEVGAFARELAQPLDRLGVRGEQPVDVRRLMEAQRAIEHVGRDPLRRPTLRRLAEAHAPRRDVRLDRLRDVVEQPPEQVGLRTDRLHRARRARAARTSLGRSAEPSSDCVAARRFSAPCSSRTLCSGSFASSSSTPAANVMPRAVAAFRAMARRVS